MAAFSLSYGEFLWQRWQALSPETAAVDVLDELRQLTEQLTAHPSAKPLLRQLLWHWSEHPGLQRLRSTPAYWDECEALEHRLRQTWEEWRTEREADSPLARHLRQLQALRQQVDLREATDLQALCEADHSLWLGERLQIQPRVALREVPGLRLPPNRRFALPQTLRNPAAQQPLPPEPDTEDLPVIWEHLDRLEEPFRASGQDLLSFILSQVDESEELETEVQELFFRLVGRWSRRLRIGRDTVEWGGRRWAQVWPHARDSG